MKMKEMEKETNDNKEKKRIRIQLIKNNCCVITHRYYQPICFQYTIKCIYTRLSLSNQRIGKSKCYLVSFPWFVRSLSRLRANETLWIEKYLQSITTMIELRPLVLFCFSCPIFFVFFFYLLTYANDFLISFSFSSSSKQTQSQSLVSDST